MLKFGVISAVDHANGLARVDFQEDNFVSGWLKIGVTRSLNDQFSFPYSINEHVYCLMDENWEYGVVCGAVYDEKNLPTESAPGLMQWRFRDDSVISYNTLSRTLKIDIKGDININCEKAEVVASDEINVTAPEVSITAANTNINGVLKVTGAAIIQGVVSMGGISGIEGSPVSGSSAELEVLKLTAVEVKASGIDLTTHTHISGTAGSPTSTPTP